MKFKFSKFYKNFKRMVMGQEEEKLYCMTCGECLSKDELEHGDRLYCFEHIDSYDYEYPKHPDDYDGWSERL